jgi:hypothetical protein
MPSKVNNQLATPLKSSTSCEKALAAKECKPKSAIAPESDIPSLRIDFRKTNVHLWYSNSVRYSDSFRYAYPKRTTVPLLSSPSQFKFALCSLELVLPANLPSLSHYLIHKSTGSTSLLIKTIKFLIPGFERASVVKQ